MLKNNEPNKDAAWDGMCLSQVFQRVIIMSLVYSYGHKIQAHMLGVSSKFITLRNVRTLLQWLCEIESSIDPF